MISKTLEQNIKLEGVSLMICHSNIKDVEYVDSTIVVRISSRFGWVLSYLEGIDGAVSSDDNRTWSVPISSLAEFYKFSVRWGVNLPDNLLTELEQRIRSGEDLPVLLDIFRNQRRTGLARKLNLPILNHLVFYKRSSKYGSWRRWGRFAIASPSQRKAILDTEKKALDRTRQRHERWLSSDVSDSHLCGAFSTICQELVRLHRLEDEMAAKAEDCNYDEASSLFLYRSKQAAERRKDLRMLYDACLQIFVIQNGLQPIRCFNTTIGYSDQSVQVYEYYEHTLYHLLDSESYKSESEWSPNPASRNRVSLERAVFFLISYLRERKSDLEIDAPSGLHYATFLSAFVDKAGSRLKMTLEGVFEAIEFDEMSREELSAALCSIFALGYKIPDRKWTKYFGSYDLEKLCSVKDSLPQEALPDFDRAVAAIEAGQLIVANIQEMSQS